jgi:hypothetical protein
MPKEDKPRRFRNLAIAGKARVKDLFESFRHNFKSQRDSTTTLEVSFASLRFSEYFP